MAALNNDIPEAFKTGAGIVFPKSVEEFKFDGVSIEPAGLEDVMTGLGTIHEHLHDDLEVLCDKIERLDKQVQGIENVLQAIQKMLADMTTPLPPKTIWDPANGVASLGLVHSHLESLNFVPS